ncbi:unnamed protein product [Lampetra planeri]
MPSEASAVATAREVPSSLGREDANPRKAGAAASSTRSKSYAPTWQGLEKNASRRIGEGRTPSPDTLVNPAARANALNRTITAEDEELLLARREKGKASDRAL